jgi:D-aminopeptidase
MPKALNRDIEARIAQFCTADEPGVAVGLARHGKPLATIGHGLANLETGTPFTPQTRFRICSISKQFLCALVWRAHRAGLLDVMAHPSRYTGAFAGLDPSLTLIDLMQNRSGIRDHWVLAMWMGAKAEQRFTLDDGEEVIRRAGISMFAPNSQNLYCNANFVILERVLEAVSGSAYAELLHAHLLDPLAMHDSFLGVDCSLPLPGGPVGYRRHHGVFEPEVNGMHWSGPAGLVSTIDDMLKWEACLTGPLRAKRAFVADILRATPFADGATALYASGIGVAHENGRTQISHSGALRGWRSAQHRHLPEGVSAYVFINRTASPRALAIDIARLAGAPPLWETNALRRRASSLPCGHFFSRELGLLFTLDDTPEGAVLLSFGDDTPLFQRADGAFESEDWRTIVSIDGRAELSVQQRDRNVRARAVMMRGHAAAFAAHGEFVCDALGSRARIQAGGESLSIVFEGIFGVGIHHALHPISADLAWFDIPRGVDEMPPGRCVVFHDAKASTIEVSAALARRVVFRQ